MEPSLKITKSSQAASLLRDSLSGLDHEEMWAVFLTSANRVIASEMITRGTLTSTPIDPRSVIKRALMNNAAAVIILHNHPSGESSPSLSDINQTSRLRKACDLMDISLIDHIILAGGKYFSFSDDGSFEFDPNDPPFIRQTL